MFFRPTKLSINLSALEQNYHRIRQLVGPTRSICAVVKANGYGMGAKTISRTLEALDCDSFGVATLKEAAELRQAGITKPIIMLGALYGRDSLWEALLLDLEISIHHLAALKDLAAVPPGDRAKLKLHLKVDTGMSRLGLQPEEMAPWCVEAKDLGLNLKGVFTTFSSSDQRDNPRTREQTNRFVDAIQILKSHDFDPPLVHAANSGAILNFPDSLFTMVRPGLLLHGVPSYPGKEPDGFRAIARMESEIVQITEYPENTHFGYSGSFTSERPTRAAVVPVGYADGLNRQLSNKGTVLVNGKRVKIIGRISMDLTIVDITDFPEMKLGDPVTILGKDGEDEICAWELARETVSIPWELFCWIGPRVPRAYTHDEDVV